MFHAHARLNIHGRRLLAHRVIEDGRPVAHVAKELGVSRQCASRWVGRFRAEGEAGLRDRSSRPHHQPRRTPPVLEAAVLIRRRTHREGADVIGPELGIPARTVGAILARHRVPPLRECDPVTGELIRTSRTTTRRHEREIAGDLIHVDVKKVGRIPDGGGWRAHGRSDKVRGRGIGFDYVHAAVDDHTRLAYAEVLPNEQGATCAAFLRRAGEFFAAHDITTIRQVMSDNALNYTRSRDFAAVIADLGAEHITIRPHCPWQNGKVERFNCTLQIE